MLIKCPISPAVRPALLYIASNMREWDRREIYATRWDDNPEKLADDCLKYGFGWVFVDDHPIAAVGAAPMHPGVWSVWCFGTDEFKKAGLGLTKHIKRVIIPTLAEKMGAHRAQCFSIEGHVDAQR